MAIFLESRCELWLPTRAERLGFASCPRGSWLQSSGAVQPADRLRGGTFPHNLAGSGPVGHLREMTARGPPERSGVAEWALFNEEHPRTNGFQNSSAVHVHLGFILTLATFSQSLAFISHLSLLRKETLLGLLGI